MTSDRKLATELEAREVASTRASKTGSAGLRALPLEGSPHLDSSPHPTPDPEEQGLAPSFCEGGAVPLSTSMGTRSTERAGAQEVLDGLAAIGASHQDPRGVRGLGLCSSSSTARSRSSAPAVRRRAPLSAHQSIGVPGPLLEFGTDERSRYLPGSRREPSQRSRSPKKTRLRPSQHVTPPSSRGRLALGPQREKPGPPTARAPTSSS